MKLMAIKSAAHPLAVMLDTASLAVSSSATGWAAQCPELMIYPWAGKNSDLAQALFFIIQQNSYCIAQFVTANVIMPYTRADPRPATDNLVPFHPRL